MRERRHMVPWNGIKKFFHDVEWRRIGIMYVRNMYDLEIEVSKESQMQSCWIIYIYILDEIQSIS